MYLPFRAEEEAAVPAGRMVDLLREAASQRPFFNLLGSLTDG